METETKHVKDLFDIISKNLDSKLIILLTKKIFYGFSFFPFYTYRVKKTKELSHIHWYENKGN